MTYNCENSNVESFRYRVGLLQEWFQWYGNKKRNKDVVSFEINIFTPKWCYDSKNQFVSTILEEVSPKNFKSGFFLYSIGDDSQSDIHSINDLITGKACRIYNKELGKPANNINNKIYRFNKQKIGLYEYKLIFWWLAILALDHELYYKYLDYVVDVADIFYFNEDMMSDWCEAVIYWLNGNEFSDDCNINFKSQEGIKFFLNK